MKKRICAAVLVSAVLAVPTAGAVESEMPAWLNPMQVQL